MTNADDTYVVVNGDSLENLIDKTEECLESHLNFFKSLKIDKAWKANLQLMLLQRLITCK